MTYIIAEPCIDVEDKSCVEVCPVDCIYEIADDGTTPHGGTVEEGRKEMLYIHPEECIDCGACEPVCPVDAIFMDEEVPEKWQDFTEYNYRLSAVPFP